MADLNTRSTAPEPNDQDQESGWSGTGSNKGKVHKIKEEVDRVIGAIPDLQAVGDPMEDDELSGCICMEMRHRKCEERMVVTELGRADPNFFNACCLTAFVNIFMLSKV